MREALQAWQREQGLTDRQAADQLGYHPEYWANVRRGRHPVTADMVLRAAAAWPGFRQVARQYIAGLVPADDAPARLAGTRDEKTALVA